MNTLPETHRRPLFPRGPSLGLRTLLLAGLSLALIFNDSRSDALQPVRSTLSFLLAPLVWAAALPHHLAAAAENLDSREALERENRALKEKQLLLEVRLQRMAALEAENRRIRELLASAARIDDQVLIAEIIAVSQDPYRNQITLNKGARDGVYRGQALVDAHGVLGQIVEVGPRQSKALLITDPDHGIPVEVNRTGMQTIAIGSGDERGLRLPFLASNADIKVGDLLVSSALGGRFPAGYPVGTVYEVKHVAGEHFMEAYASPAARLNQGRQALLVWSEHFHRSDEHDDALQAPAATTDPAP
ncbi:rod shape-determining protein MreC [Fontimonas thermophila]|uniref:Cell shape-determining protein MreC n=1 Tax=Fontimonas thermophila TaxID=1076937 RepID=A0A1I2J1Q1_9GAMM|nr:rod shape-determining protein MreC [Fontimonas thermophila]SFF47177.1 rod shape-determining protein MreC [Fontimonas thermophila]